MRRFNYFFVSIFITMQCFTHCSSSTNSKKNTTSGDYDTIIVKKNYDTFETGKIIYNVKLKSDSTQGFTLYLPKEYNSQIKLAVIYFFDPHAAGKIPVEKYSALAEKYNFILVGSNNSKNGNMQEKSNKIIADLFYDTQSRLLIDDKQIFTSGFSGGARVASSAAIFYGGVAAVAACGAGFPAIKSAIKTQFDFLGLAGNEDFNLTELKMLIKALNNSPIQHTLIEFDGKHEWPPINVMADAFNWFQFSSMRNKVIAKNDSIIDAFIKENENILLKHKSENDILLSVAILEKIIAFTSGLADNTARIKKLEELKQSDAYKKKNAEIEQIEQIEEQTKQKYAAAMQQQNIDWWKSEILLLNKKNADSKINASNKRVLAYLSLLAYSSTTSSLKFNEPKAALHFLELYSLIDPTNSEYAFLYATYYAKNSDYDNALKYLRMAVYKLGFSDYERMKNDADLLTLQTKYKEFEELMSATISNSNK